MLPPTYPLRPPSFRFLTPSGRFETNREICLSISGHHEETWQPAWGVRTALVALRSFMETDVRGQLGGLEAAEPVRRRLAAESPAWRCGVCCGGKTNAEIMAECEQRVRELAAASGKEEEEVVVVPPELTMGWRDEMEKQKKKKGAEGEDEDEDGDGDEDGESARLAEGFVRTAPASGSGSGSGSASASSAETADPGPGRAAETAARSVPPTTETASPPNLGPAAAPAPTQQQAIQRRVSNDDVPVWLDRLIIAVAVLLAAVVAKVMLA